MSDPNALVELVRSHSVQVRTFIARYVRGSQLVDELATETFRRWQIEGHDGLAVAERWLSLASEITQERLGQLAGEARRAGRQTERLVHQWQRARLAHEAAIGQVQLAEIHDERLKMLSSVLDQLPGEELELWRAHYLQRRTAQELAQELAPEARGDSRDSRHLGDRLYAMRSRVLAQMCPPSSPARKSSRLSDQDLLRLWAQFVADELPLADDGRLAERLTRGEQTAAALADIECDQLLRASAESERTVESFVDRVLLSCSISTTALSSHRGELSQSFAPRQVAVGTPANVTSRERHGRRALLSIGALGATACLMFALLSHAGARSSSQSSQATEQSALASLPPAQIAANREANPTTMPIWRSSRDESPSIPTAAGSDDRSAELRPAASTTLMAVTAATPSRPSDLREDEQLQDELEDEQLEDEQLEDEQLEETLLAKVATTGVEAPTSGDLVDHSASVAEIGDGAGVANDADKAQLAGNPVAPVDVAATGPAVAPLAIAAAPPGAGEFRIIEARQPQWAAAAPSDLQRTLLKLKQGEVTVACPQGHATIVGETTVVFDVDRITLTTGLLRLRAERPWIVDSPFGTTVVQPADTQRIALVSSNVDGLFVALESGTAVITSPDGATQSLQAPGRRLLTSTGKVFGWHVSVDWDAEQIQLTVNGETSTLLATEQGSQRQLARQLAKWFNQMDQQLRTTAAQAPVLGALPVDGAFRGMVRFNDRVTTYASLEQLPLARETLNEQLAAFREGRAAPGARGAVALRGEAHPIAPASVERRLTDAANRWLIGNEDAAVAPRIQRANELELTQLLMQAPEIEIYRDLRESAKMTHQLKLMSNLDRVSVPPRREPVFEILPQRPDLQGLPFLRGESCLLPMDERNWTANLSRISRTMGGGFLAMSMFGGAQPAQVPGMVQILQAKGRNERLALNQMLTSVGTPRAIEQLARRAIFDLSPEARSSAINGLRPSTPVARATLLAGLRYPWAPASMHAAEALVRLEDQDAVPDLVAMLDEKTPVLSQQANGQWVKHELVRINHMKNCMLCHAPSTSRSDLMRGRVPEPELPVTSADPVPVYYGSNNSPGPFVRADITYLRQDFSATSYDRTVRPWPAEQRFDFLVRTRPLSAWEARAMSQSEVLNDYPQRHAVLFALRELTGKDLGIHADAWRAGLKP